MKDDAANTDAPTRRMMVWARNSAAYRLQRRMHTEKQLFDAISRKARQKFESISNAQIKALAELAVKFAYEQKALDDVAFAETRIRSGMRSGKSKRAIAHKLSQNGIASATAAAALSEVKDFYAALVFARKRGFGAFRKGALDEKGRAKELSAFARAGFSFDVGRKVSEMSLADAEDALEVCRPL